MDAVIFPSYISWDKTKSLVHATCFSYKFIYAHVLSALILSYFLLLPPISHPYTDFQQRDINCISFNKSREIFLKFQDGERLVMGAIGSFYWQGMIMVSIISFLN